MLRVLAAVAAAGVLAPAAIVAANAADPDRFVGLRVCSATSFSRQQGRCTKDERKTAITSNRISCSVSLVASHPGVWRARFRYAGAVESWGRGGTLSKGTHRLFLNTNIKTNLPLPGGDWGCDFAFRSTGASASFRSGGPIGEIVDTAVCPESDLLSYGSRLQEKTCATDRAEGTLPVSEPVYCSAVYAGVGGKSAQIQFLRADGSPLFVWNFQITWPTIYQAYAFINPSVFKTEGDYLCRYTLSDGMTVDKPFRIGPPG